MARSDLELGAEWAARAKDEPAPLQRELAALTETWNRLRTSERATKTGLDAGQHRWLAEERERVRRENEPVAAAPAEPDEEPAEGESADDDAPSEAAEPAADSAPIPEPEAVTAQPEA